MKSEGRKVSRRKHSVHWFRKGLRLSDNPALLRGIRRCETFRCIFILDPWFAGSSNVGTNKWRFLLQCLEDLDSSLRKLNSRLFVIRGQPADVLPTLFKDWGTTYFTFEEDPEPFGRVRDQNIVAMCKEMNIAVSHEHSHTLYHLEKIIEKNNGSAPLTYKQFQRIIDGIDPPAKPVPTLTPQMLGSAFTPLEDDHDEKFGVPTLEELGFDCDHLKPPVWVGGESEALSRLERHLERKAWVASFGRPKMTPQSLLASPTGLSPYLRFGCLSTRLFYHALSDLYRKIKKCDPPLSLHGQLLWREFFYCAATRNPNFDKMVGNQICIQIPWDSNSEALAKWANAQTGFPWIDAIMTQLREEGWIHHLARHATENLVQALQSSKKSQSVTLHVLQVIANATSFARTLVSSASNNPRSTRLVVSASMMEATEGLSEGPVTSRPASLGLLLVSLTNVNNQLSRSQTGLADYKERLSSLQTLPVTELVRLAEVNPTEKLPTVLVRRMAQDKVTATISSKQREVELCGASVEGLTFLAWRHLEHFLLYSGAAAQAGQGTPIQEAYSRHVSHALEQGYTTTLKQAGFGSVDLDKLKKDVLSVLNETFFDKIGDNVSTVETIYKSKAAASGFLQSVLRRTKRLSTLHSQ